MRDRLSELTAKSETYSSQDDKDDTEENTSPRRGSIVVYMDRRNTLTALEDSFMHDFFVEEQMLQFCEQMLHNLDSAIIQVEETRTKIENIDKQTAEIQRLHGKVLSSPRNEPSIKRELDERMASVKTVSVEVRKTLHCMMKIIEEEEVTQRRGTKTSNLSDMWSDAEFRIRRTQHAMLSRQFTEALNKFANIREEYTEKYKEWLKKQLRIVNRELNDEQLEDIMEKGEANIFTDNVLANTLEARQALADVASRHEEILRIEKSMRELRDLFLEMAILVSTQGEIINNIEYHVSQTRHYAAKGKRKIEQAKKLKQGARKKKIIIIVIVILVAIVLGLILYFTIAPVK